MYEAGQSSCLEEGGLAGLPSPQQQQLHLQDRLVIAPYRVSVPGAYSGVSDRDLYCTYLFCLLNPELHKESVF